MGFVTMGRGFVTIASDPVSKRHHAIR